MTREKDGTGRNISPSELHLPEFCDEERYAKSIVAWDIMKDVDLTKPQNFPGLGARDLLPKTGTVYQPDIVPQRNGWAPHAVPHEYFVVGKRADGMPVEVVEYDHDQSGKPVYKQQYLFQYDKLADGQTRVSVQNWVNAKLATQDGLHMMIGRDENVIRGISQYYFDASGVTKAEYWNAQSLKAPKDKQTPDIRIMFEPGSSTIGVQQKPPAGILSGVIREAGPQAINNLQSLAPKFSFYNLFAPPIGR